MAQEQDKLAWIYASQGTEQLRERYDRWASEYDRDLAEWGFSGPQAAAVLLAKQVRTDAVVLDAGAGTGLVGVELAKLGFTTIDGIDFSPGMLREAGAKGIYRDLRPMDLTQSLGFDDDAYDACICVGTLTLAHVPASAIDELIRVVKPGGTFVYTLITELLESAGFAAKHAELEAAGKWRLAEKTAEFAPMPEKDPDLFYVIWAFEVL